VRRFVTLRAMLNWGRWPLSDLEQAGMYGLSWLFVDWLYNTHRESFIRYMEGLASGTPSGFSWEGAFGSNDLTVDEVERALTDFARHGSYEEFTQPLRATPHAVDSQLMAPSEAHAARAQILLASLGKHQEKSRVDELKGEVKKALDLEPANLDALMIDELDPLPDRLGRLRRAVAVFPNDPRPYMMLGDELARTKGAAAERESAYRKALALNAASTNKESAQAPDPQLLHALAAILLERGEASEALPLADRAAKAAPYSADISATLAVALERVDRCDEALVEMERAVERVLESGRAIRQRIARRVAEIPVHCGKYLGPHLD